jgi:hypothetical protein
VSPPALHSRGPLLVPERRSRHRPASAPVGSTAASSAAPPATSSSLGSTTGPVQTRRRLNPPNLCARCCHEGHPRARWGARGCGCRRAFGTLEGKLLVPTFLLYFCRSVLCARINFIYNKISIIIINKCA